ncbi:MAG: hypothetical protein RMK01_10835 [Thermomicrobium sp.]|nr:hypothetical protein [Thermomicrobium sp.]
MRRVGDLLPMRGGAGRKPVTRLVGFLVCTVPGLLALALALPSVSLSFLMDDSYDLIMARRSSYQELLLAPVPGSSYYRPLSFVLFKVVADLRGGTEPWQYRTLAVLLHAVNALLLAAIVRRFAGSLAALASGVLFATFPFAYQALQVVGALPHVLVTTCFLAGALAWSIGGTRPARRASPWYALAAAAATLAPGFHETGALSGALLLLLSAARGRVVNRESLSALPWILVALVADLAAVWAWFWGLDKPDARPATPIDRLENVAFWLQAAAYPVTRQLALLFDAAWLARHAWMAVAAAALGGLGVALAVSWRGGRVRLAACTLLLGFLVFVPAILFLPYRGYVEDGPRLLYPATPAVAAFWGLLPAAALRWRRARRLAIAATSCLLGVAVLQGAAFVVRRTELAQRASAAQEAVVAVARSNPGRPLLVVNGPAWLALHRYEYPLGHYGVVAQPPYHGYDALLEARLGRRQPVLSLAVEPSRSLPEWTYWPHGRPGTRAELAALRYSGWLVVRLEPDEARDFWRREDGWASG